MDTRRAAKINAELQEEQKCAEMKTKRRLFDLLRKKLDIMNAHQARRHGKRNLGEICACENRSLGEKRVSPS